MTHEISHFIPIYTEINLPFYFIFANNTSRQATRLPHRKKGENKKNAQRAAGMAALCAMVGAPSRV
ncbi:MAG: hypothetical protein A3C12_02405 [Candidatus Sungbacteria bacterium RIFCSPHIGHO2_02_FULL_49_20]|uniref:Uncharacterized protein n=1 Tax=Candidatus Sungbacteria bacterium RIFCSPHIGHO2_02_FULL_49_20 TaxID=1802272 RepID=A0A1G2KNX8_9BACT|nr:MAG: hypothetical protein A3C12_02405 [Candidatus Sungbacteria bacterium RIFCSPHIGHO2_02_FULL_49_20]